MKSRMLFSFAAGLLVLGMNASPASAEYPAHEVWIGFGGAASGEKNIFNTPTDLESSPDVVTTLMYTKNFDANKALALHLYGGTETTAKVTLTSSSGTIDTDFDLSTFNIGARYRHTFSRGTISPYLFGGASYVFGSISSSPTGELNFSGVSGIVGPGASLRLGKSFMLSAELFASFGTANWEQEPFTNSTGKEFDPSLYGGTVNIGFAWGWQQ